MSKFYAIFLLLLVFACQAKSGKNSVPTRKVTDALGREVALPDTVNRAVCIRASAIRLVTYAGGVPFICGVEEQETRENVFTHLLAHPELGKKPLIGPQMGGDAELIMAVQPDVIFMSSTTAGDADDLQRRTGIPVVALEYGDLGAKRPIFYASLRRIGEVLHTEGRVDSLIRYTENQIAELQQRTQHKGENKRVYVGGLAYKGLKGITSTDPYYAAFGFLGVDNVASAIDSAYVSPITGTYIDWEQLVDWDPEVIFIDRSGWPLVNEDFKNREKLNQLLAAYRNQQVYALWPYNNNHTNFEVMLINAWYAGKILFPDQFQDISLRDKADEILVEFVGQPIGQELRTKWGDYENLLTENHER